MEDDPFAKRMCHGKFKEELVSRVCADSIAAARTLKGISQGALANAIGEKVHVINGIENCTARYVPAQISKLDKYFATKFPRGRKEGKCSREALMAGSDDLIVAEDVPLSRA